MYSYEPQMVSTVLKYCGTILRVKTIEHSCSTEQKKQMWHKNAACLNIIRGAATEEQPFMF